MSNLKAIPMTRNQLKDTLQSILDRVSIGDSMEGWFEYLMPYDENDKLIEDADFMVRGTFRVGNLQGQGGMRMIGEMTDADRP